MTDYNKLGVRYAVTDMTGATTVSYIGDGQAVRTLPMGIQPPFIVKEVRGEPTEVQHIVIVQQDEDGYYYEQKVPLTERHKYPRVDYDKAYASDAKWRVKE